MQEEKIPDQVKRLQAHFFGQRYSGAHLAATRLSPGHAQVMATWLKQRKGMLVLAGIPGCGKTYICAALVAWMYGKVRDMFAFTESDFISRIKASFDMKGTFEEEIIYQCDHEFLIFDDLASTGFGSTDFKKNVLFQTINCRYESQLPTVFSTNLSRKEISENLGMRASSRLYSSENCIVEMFDYPDLRYPDATKIG